MGRVVLAAITALLGTAACILLPALPGERRAAADPGPEGRFVLLGHEPLMNRGMNSALAIAGDHAYVGSRTDGTHANAGVMVVDIADPSAPHVVGQIGPPDEGNPGESSRELRVWPQQHLLIVLNIECGAVGHKSPDGQLARGKAFGIGSKLAATPGNVTRGCPWGWSRVIDVADQARPLIVAQYKVLPWNDSDNCGNVTVTQDNLASFSSHNPTAMRGLAFVTWHSAGLQAIDLRDPRAPRRAAAFRPQPLPAVADEDPALSSGTEKVVMWSYPIVRDGLVYVVDLRNGLYVLRYEGPGASELRCVPFREGNSNLGALPRSCTK